jgi:hypothetical protein
MSADKTIIAISRYDGAVQMVCNCGYATERRATWETAGLDLDRHLAQVFPLGTERMAHKCQGVEVAA